MRAFSLGRRLAACHGSRAHMSTSVLLLSRSDADALAPRTAMELLVPVPSSDGIRDLSVFVVRSEAGRLSAYENFCPHAGGPLNLLPDRFFSRDGDHLMCTRHAAKFAPETGECVHGPCVGASLHALPIERTSGGEVVSTLGALQLLCETGGGSFVLRDGEAEAPLVAKRVETSRLPPRLRARARARREARQSREETPSARRRAGGEEEEA